MTLAPARALAAGSAFVSVVAFEAARVKRRIANDPPRDDYASRTYSRRRRVNPKLLMEDLAADDETAWLFANLGALLAQDEALERALLRAFERAAGAFQARDTHAGEARISEVSTFAGRAAATLGELTGLSTSLAESLAALEIDVTSVPGDVRDRSLEEILPDDVLAALYRAGIGISEIRYAYVDSISPQVQHWLATALREASPTLERLGAAISAWKPERDARKATREAFAGPAFEIFEESDGTYGWRLRSADGRLLATSSERFETQAAVRREIEQLKRSLGNASVLEM